MHDFHAKVKYMIFQYTEKIDDYKDLLKTPIINFLSKHVLDISGEKALSCYNNSLSFGYRQVLWSSKSPELDKAPIADLTIYHSMYIKALADKLDNITLRVIVFNDSVWIDNLHSAVAFIGKYGAGLTLESVDFYIVDMRDITPTIASPGHKMRKAIPDIKENIERATDRAMRYDNDTLQIDYTIKDLIDDNDLLRYFE